MLSRLKMKSVLSDRLSSQKTPCPTEFCSAILPSTTLTSMLTRLLYLPVLLLMTFSSDSLFAQTPEWIWGTQAHDKETRYFRKTFILTEAAKSARVTVACDNRAEFYLNGQRIVRNTEWSKPSRANMTAKVKVGENTVTISASNADGIAGLLTELEITRADDSKLVIVSDASWQTAENPSGDVLSTKFPSEGWVAATSLGKLGREPWGDILKPAVATAADAIHVLDGFKVELLLSAQPAEGSWVSMTVDNKGRLIVSPQGDEPMLRLTLDGRGQVAKIETIDLPVRGAMGLLYAFDSLYVNGQGKEGYHLYRLKDTNGDDQYDAVEILRRWKGGAGEHGAHGIVLGQDQRLYTVEGNFVDVPSDLASSSPHRNYADDLVLPRVEDGNGFGSKRKPPGGYVARMNPDGSHCELFASGQRNTYDIAFNPEGELFGFDSDMEWDWGTPWYRPIRAYHIVSGGDQGFREGSAKWPEYYADSLPAAANIGIGSPTGVRFGTGAKFPTRYQRAFYMMDWSYGRIVAVHLSESGASYSGTYETFVKGKPLNVTDFEIGSDGALYFLTGGRGTQSGLYRVSYTGSDSVAPAAPSSDTAARSARTLRHQLESFHGLSKAGALDIAWPNLGSSDRWIRYAARIAVETQPVESWRDRALAETNGTAGLHALLALARLGTKADQEPLLKALARWPLSTLDQEHQLIKLRVIEVSVARQGLPSEELQKMAVEKLSRQFPAKSWPLNRELSQILIALNSPGIVSQVLALRDTATTQEEQLHYMLALRKASTSAWTMEDRTRYFGWLNATPSAANSSGVSRTSAHPADVVQWFRDVGLEASNGASFDGFLRELRNEVINSLPLKDKEALADILQPAKKTATKTPVAARSFVRDWKMADIIPVLDQVARGRKFQRGKEAFAAGQCAVCHRFSNEGGAVGPDLAGISSRFSRADILSSILEPSKVISEQYENTTFLKNDADEISGRVLEEKGDRIVLLTSPLTGGTTEIKKSEIKSRRKATLSPMPEGLVNSLSKEELLDLMAYLESSGNPNHADFKKE